jgi:hypothetical protein
VPDRLTMGAMLVAAIACAAGILAVVLELRESKRVDARQRERRQRPYDWSSDAPRSIRRR